MQRLGVLCLRLQKQALGKLRFFRLQIVWYGFVWIYNVNSKAREKTQNILLSRQPWSASDWD